MLEVLKEMEQRIKIHITDCKREVVKEVQKLAKKDEKQPKEKQNGSSANI